MNVKHVLMGMALFIFAVVSPSHAGNAGARLVGQVIALLEQHDAAFAAQDVTGVMKTYVAGPEIFLMGTGPGEIYRGKEGIEGAYSQFFNKFDKGSVGFTYNWVSAGSRGDWAWFATECMIKGKIKDEMKEIGINLSGTLQKHKGKWRILAMHFSRLGVAAEPDVAQQK